MAKEGPFVGILGAVNCAEKGESCRYNLVASIWSLVSRATRSKTPASNLSLLKGRSLWDLTESKGREKEKEGIQ